MNRARLVAIVLLLLAAGMAVEVVRIIAGDRALAAHVESR